MANFFGESHYVSAIEHELQTVEASNNIDGPILYKSVKPTNTGVGLILETLKDQAEALGVTGVYYSKQGPNDYIVFCYVNPVDTILTTEQIVTLTRNNTLSSSSIDLGADVQATEDYYSGVLNNKMTQTGFEVYFTFSNEFQKNSNTMTNLDTCQTSTNTSVPNAIASGQYLSMLTSLHLTVL